MSKKGTYKNYLDRYSEDPVPRTTKYRQKNKDKNHTFNLQCNNDMCNTPKEEAFGYMANLVDTAFDSGRNTTVDITNENMSAPLCDIIDDIEDLILSQDITPKERYSYKKNNIRPARKKKKEEIVFPEIQIYSSVIPGTQTIYIKTWGCTHNSSDSEYMAGQLSMYGYNLTEDKSIADLWILNSCTVKNPAEDHFKNEINLARKLGKHIVVSGCVPQGAPKSNFIQGLSIIGVQQIDRVVEVVEETLKGNTVKFLNKKKEAGKKIGGAPLSLPKVRRNPLIEIIAINTGCLNQCTYCKTKHARGELGSYRPEEIIDRAIQAFKDGIKELWLTSEDTGAYGKDIDTNLPELLWKLIDVIPDKCRMRIGMTNPPYILEHLEEIGKILKHPKVYSFLHIPVQSGSDRVLFDMKREYSRSDFENIVDFLKEKIPNINIATDVICGFPTETSEDFEETMSLCQKYKFSTLFINQFFPRQGTPAAKMIQVPSKEIKNRTKLISEFFQSYEPYNTKIGEIQEVLVTEIAHDNKHYVAHNSYYEQVLIPMKKEYMGEMLKVKIISASKHSMKGEAFDEYKTKVSRPFLTQALVPEEQQDVKQFTWHMIALLIIIFAIIVKLCSKFVCI
ncbi:CDKAL1-like protein isoform X2 [Nasonia vitripennis]|uniref:Threonylcarbamoyladenosine tRNA methylthiotransferase n=1 Tax=Nasonia vitripennis TaxID=7425 RepID=A0A7M7Q9J1_NASVI|nr:CDKAL1-like protein isoform X2 [Nasonia vitripennis]